MSFIEKYNLLPENIKDFFSSNEFRLGYEKACFSYNVPEEEIEKIAKIITEIFLKEKPLGQLPVMIRINLGIDDRISFGIAFEISKKLFAPFPEYFFDIKELMNNWQALKIPTIVSEEKAWKRVLDVEPWILEEEKEKKKEIQENLSKFEQIGIEAAIDKYPPISELAISANYIKIEESVEPARPSIKNWIQDYHDKNGVGKHSPIDRGNYLFHSENGKKLSPSERQKVGMILKSLDEQTPLEIDIEKQIVIFDGQQSDKFQNNVSNQNNARDNQEPTDIFELKINNTGKTLHKTDFTNDRLGNNDADTVSRVAPFNLPVEEELENERPFKLKEESGAIKIGSDSYNREASSFGESQSEMPNKIIDLNPGNITQPKTETKPKVELKNISFSPSFIANPTWQKPKFENQPTENSFLANKRTALNSTEKTNQINDKQEEQTFNIPSSKPPIGTDEYNVNKSKVEEKFNDTIGIFSASMPSLSSAANSNNESLLSEKQISDIKNVDKNDVKVSTVEDLDSLSDEMLLKLYQERRGKNGAAPFNPTKPRGFHIGLAHDSDEIEKSGNVVDLKNL